jgi:protein-S-isoprenylcysteine O-methyltransferase Ste14
VLKSKFLVFLQFASIIWILIPKKSVEIFSLWWIFVLFASIFSVWIFLHNRIGNFNITPEIKDGAKFVSSGPYRHIRHPMYFALIVGVFGVLMRLFSYSNLFAFLVMITAVYLKARIEERLWMDHHKEYEEYLNTTKMIIPFVL